MPRKQMKCNNEIKFCLRYFSLYQNQVCCARQWTARERKWSSFFFLWPGLQHSMRKKMNFLEVSCHSKNPGIATMGQSHQAKANPQPNGFSWFQLHFLPGDTKGPQVRAKLWVFLSSFLPLELGLNAQEMQFSCSDSDAY